MRVLKLLAIIYVLTLIAVLFGQRRLLYAPTKLSLDACNEIARRSGFVAWQNASGDVIGWKWVSGTISARDRVLITSGNAGCAIYRTDFATMLNQAGSFDVYILEYPGYGARAGSPSQKSFCDAADEAFGLLAKDGPFYVVGESLGTGVASYLAGAHPQYVAGLLLITPYHNLGDVAQNHMPIFPAKWMLWDKFPSGESLRRYHGRVGVLLAGKDIVVPNRFGRRLYESYAGPKRLWEVASATHDSAPFQPSEWWKEVVAFWKQ